MFYISYKPRKPKLYFFYVIYAIIITLSSCSDDKDLYENERLWNNEDIEITDEEDETIPQIPTDLGDPGDNPLITNSQNLDIIALRICFSSDSTMIENPYPDVVVTNEPDGHVIIKSETDEELNYILSGITENGSVKIYGEKKFNLYLNGVGITNPNGAAINNQCGKKATVYLVDETTNRLIDGEEYISINDEDMKGTFFSEGQLIFEGGGTLEIRGKNKHAICSDDYIQISSGNIWIKEAASDAIHANDYVLIEGGIITTRSIGEGIECEKGYVEILGGTVEIITIGKKGHGIKSKTTTLVNTTGTINITTYGDASKGFNSEEGMEIINGTIYIQTAGDAFWEEEEADISSCAGIKCDKNLDIYSGDITIISVGSGGKGINITGDLNIYNANLIIYTTGDQYVYDRNNDTAAKAIRVKGDLTIYDGVIKIRTYKTEAEGLESKANLVIKGGNLDVRAYDDCINAGTHIQIDGGYIYCLSSANDGIDSNGTLSVTGGVIVSAGTTSPEAGIDCDNGDFEITGGIIIGIGGDTSIPTSRLCTQPSVVFKTSSSNISTLCIESDSGEQALVFKLPVTYSRSMAVLFSSPELKSNTNYTIYTNGDISGGSNYFYGIYTGATYSNGSSVGTFSTNSMVSSVGSNLNRPF